MDTPLSGVASIHGAVDTVIAEEVLYGVLASSDVITGICSTGDTIVTRASSGGNEHAAFDRVTHVCGAVLTVITEA